MRVPRFAVYRQIRFLAKKYSMQLIFSIKSFIEVASKQINIIAVFKYQQLVLPIYKHVQISNSKGKNKLITFS